MKEANKYLGKIIAVRDEHKNLISAGICVAFTDRPTITVNKLDGTQVNWMADMCEVIEIPADVADHFGYSLSYVRAKEDEKL